MKAITKNEFRQKLRDLMIKNEYYLRVANEKQINNFIEGLRISLREKYLIIE